MMERQQRAKEAARLFWQPIPENPAISFVKIDLEKPFMSSSGLYQPIYFEVRNFQTPIEARNGMIRLMADMIGESEERLHSQNSQTKGLRGLAAVASSGIFLAAFLARAMDLEMVTVLKTPKDHGSGEEIAGVVKEKERYAMIEDVFNLGRSTIQAAQVLRKAGGEVTHAYSLLTYALPVTYQRFKQESITPVSLTSFSVVLREAKRMGRIDSQTEQSLRAWHKDPLSWAARFGPSQTTLIHQ